jgi:hypothetical protein
MSESLEEGVQLELRQDPECLCPTVDAAEQLTFQWRSPGLRYYLDGEGIHAGDMLEMQLDDGAWKRARYEYTWNPVTQTLEAFLHFSEERCIPLPIQARFRWPRS